MDGGLIRKRLVDKLGHAYSQGLISDRTFEARVGQALSRTIVDPAMIVGDLAVRRPRRNLRDVGSQTLDTVADRLGWTRERDCSATLLALNCDAHAHELLVGRAPMCDVVLGDSAVSRRHALLVFRDGGWILEDLASKNGTYLNGRRVGRCRLRAGDRLAIGRTRLLID